MVSRVNKVWTWFNFISFRSGFMAFYQAFLCGFQ